MNLFFTIVLLAVAFAVGMGLMWFLDNRLLIQKRKAILDDARRESEVLKQKKLLEVKEKFIQLKGELEQQVLSAAPNSNRWRLNSRIESLI